METASIDIVKLSASLRLCVESNENLKRRDAKAQRNTPGESSEKEVVHGRS